MLSVPQLCEANLHSEVEFFKQSEVQLDKALNERHRVALILAVKIERI